MSFIAIIAHRFNCMLMITNFSMNKPLININFYFFQGSFPAIGVEAFCPSFLRAGFLNSIQAPHPVTAGGSLPPRIPAGRYPRYISPPPTTIESNTTPLTGDREIIQKWILLKDIEKKCKWLYNAGILPIVSSAVKIGSK